MKKIANIAFKAFVACMLGISIAAVAKLLYEIIVNTSSVTWP